MGTHCSPFLLAAKSEPGSSLRLQYLAVSMGYHWVTLKTDSLWPGLPRTAVFRWNNEKRLLVTGSSWAQKTKISQKPDQVYLIHWIKQPKHSGLRANSVASFGFTPTHPHMSTYTNQPISTAIWKGRKREDNVNIIWMLKKLAEAPV